MRFPAIYMEMVENPEANKSHGRSRTRWEENIKMDVTFQKYEVNASLCLNHVVPSKI